MDDRLLITPTADMLGYALGDAARYAPLCRVDGWRPTHVRARPTPVTLRHGLTPTLAGTPHGHAEDDPRDEGSARGS